MVSRFSRAFRPTALAFRARSARAASVNRMRLPRRRSVSNRFSACRYSMTISCCRWTQPDTTINKKVSSGGTEPMPKVYRSRRPNIWTARPRARCRTARRHSEDHQEALPERGAEGKAAAMKEVCRCECEGNVDGPGSKKAFTNATSARPFCR